jgi:hypothetical protein
MATLEDSPASDYRVTLTANGKTTFYRCVMCALADARGKKGDIEIWAPSEVKGHPVSIDRVGGKWTVSPKSVVFTYAEGDHQQCQTRYRALSSPGAFKAYIASDPKVLGNAKQLSLAQFLNVAG